jgi:integrase
VDRKRGIEIRGNSIRLTFTYQGRRYRETVKIAPTPANIKYVERLRQTILHEIEVGRFDYVKHFPNSPRAKAYRPGSAAPVSEALRDWLNASQRTTARSTWEDYKNTVYNHLIPAFGALKLSELTTARIKTWMSQLDCSAKRVNNLLIPLRGMLEDAYADEAIERNPMARICNLQSTSKREPHPFTPDEVSRILAACDGQIRNLIQFAFATGLRTGELLGLRWGDIDLERGTAYIRRRSTTPAGASQLHCGRARFSGSVIGRSLAIIETARQTMDTHPSSSEGALSQSVSNATHVRIDAAHCRRKSNVGSTADGAQRLGNDTSRIRSMDC